MVFKNEYTIGVDGVALKNEATNTAMLSIMEDVATLHSAAVGYGVNDIEVTRRGWILLDWQLEVLRRPKYNEKLTVSTWSRKFDRVSAYRDYTFTDTKGEIIVRATSRWILFDIDSRRPQRITDKMVELYESEPDRSAFDDEMSDLKVDRELIENALTTPYKVLRRDIDINGHMHNITYLDVALEVLPLEVYEAGIFNRVRINYKKELRLGDEVTCAYYKNGDVHTVVMMTDEHLNAIVELS